ncbi:MAG: alpha/beta hydrolase [Pseudomonadota bacterium]
MTGLKSLKIIFVLAFLILLLLIPYWIFNEETKTLDDKMRRGLPGQFIKLSDGYVHYELSGPDDGPVAVLIHGISTPYFVWDDTQPALAKAGFRVLRYDLYGRGFSDRPDVTYDEQLFDRQLFELLSALKIRKPVDLVGSSMGGAIAVIFAARHPENVRKLVLISPAGYPVKIPVAGQIGRLPVVGDYMMYAFGNPIMRGLFKNNFSKSDKLSAFSEKFRQQTQYAGFKRALQSTLRNFNLDNQKTAFEAVGKQGRQVMLIWGREDKIVTFSNNEMVRAAIHDVDFHALDAAGHIPHYETPERVNPLMVDFMKR